MPQFQIRRHPHGGTFQLFHLSDGGGHWAKVWKEENSVQDCLEHCIMYVKTNSFRSKFFLEVIPD